MGSDEDYMAFLDKANQDTGSSQPAKDDKFAQTKAVDTAVPAPLKQLDAYYISDSDEPFEPVAITHDKGALDTSSFGKLISHAGDVEEVPLEEWNVKNQYDAVVDAVKKAGAGKSETKVFRVSHDSTRCEYYVVTQGEGVVVGVKVRAVES